MFARIFKAGLMLGTVSILAACASGGASKDAPFTVPLVTDPAPIVSGTMRPYQIRGRWYHPKEQPNYDEQGMASWYGAYHQGRPTSTGERFDMNALTAAHKTLPLPSLVEVTNTTNGRRVILRVNDRGPFVDGRIIDLSKGAAEELGLMSRGIGEVRVRYLGRAPRAGGGRTMQTASVSNAPDRRTAPAPAQSTSRPVPYNQVVRAEAQVGPLTRIPVVTSPPPAALMPVPAPTLGPRYLPTPAPKTHLGPQQEPQGEPPYLPTPVGPTQPTLPVSVQTPVPSVSGHWIQAAAYTDPATARRFAQRLGEQAQVQSVEMNGQTLHRILVGPWPNANAAEQARQAVVARGYRDALLISGG